MPASLMLSTSDEASALLPLLPPAGSCGLGKPSARSASDEDLKGDSPSELLSWNCSEDAEARSLRPLSTNAEEQDPYASPHLLTPPGPSGLNAPGQLLSERDGPASVSAFSHWDRFTDSSGFSGVGQPRFFTTRKQRVWARDIPARWRRLTIKTPRGHTGLDPQEVAAILDGGFWQPSVSHHTQYTAPTSDSSLKGLSKFMQAQMRILQQEAEEVVQLLRQSRRRIAHSISSSTGSISKSTAAVLARMWRATHSACCGTCLPDPYESVESALQRQDDEDQMRYQILAGEERSSDSQQQPCVMPDSSGWGMDSVDPEEEEEEDECDAKSEAALQHMGEQELHRRLIKRTSVSVAQALMRWGQADLPTGEEVGQTSAHDASSESDV